MTIDIECRNLVDRRSVQDRRRLVRRSRAGINSIILHSTSNWYLPPNQTGIPPVSVASRIDWIRAHFVIIQDGTIYYIHDCEFRSGSVGGLRGVDIEFAGEFTAPGQLSNAAISAGRDLVWALIDAMSLIVRIHPHGQVQRENMDGTPCRGRSCGKIDSCPGPEIWVNVGQWCVNHRSPLESDPTIGYQNNGISPAQVDNSYDRGLEYHPAHRIIVPSPAAP